jgi:cation:H+ antiporter
MTLLLLAIGLVILTAGAEVLVRGASSLATAAHISPLVIGLTVVAYGTSAPELAISVQSAYRGQADIAMGNVVGSNIFNILLILGISALIVPLAVQQKLIWLDVPIMIAVSFIAMFMGLDGRIGRLDGLLLVSGAVSYTVWAIVQSRRETKAIAAEYAQEFGDDGPPARGAGILVQIVLVVAGLAMLIVGARVFLDAAVGIARSLGLSELVIGLTFVAAGTSLPVVATSIVAAIRGERDIAVGNVVGSNIFNILSVLGFTSLVSSGGVTVADEALRFDIPVMIAVALACFPLFFTGHEISRWEGAVFVGYYAAYTGFLLLHALESPHKDNYSAALLWIALPLTVAGIVFSFWQSVRARGGGPATPA